MTAQYSPPPADPAAPPARRLHRSRSQRVIAGVCGGLAEEFRADPAIVRLLAVILMILTGIFPLLLLYLIAAVIIPEGDAVPGAVQVASDGTSNGAGTVGVLIGGMFVFVGLAALANQVIDVNWDMLWPIGLIGVGAAVLLVAFQRPNR
jgi:phage shock protein C